MATVLIVEDNEMNRDMLSRRLMRKGFEVVMAVERSDFPVIKAITIYIALATMLFNLLTDIVYKLIDPRVQLH